MALLPQASPSYCTHAEGIRFKAGNNAVFGMINIGEASKIKEFRSGFLSLFSNSGKKTQIMRIDGFGIGRKKGHQVIVAASPPTEDAVIAAEPLTKQDLVDYLASGCKPKENWRIGTEHEKFGFELQTLRPMTYEQIAELLNGISERFDWDKVMEGDKIIGLKQGKQSISLEPGGQFELSGAPLETLHQTCAEVNSHLYQVKAVAEEMGIGFLGIGFQPKWERKDIPIMPKGRYEIMRNYMPKVGSLGLDMMFRTCTVQVNLDFDSEADMIKKFRAGLALQPIATALFANSPFTDGKPNGYLSMRSHIWTDTDKNRAGMLPFVFDESFGFEQYVDYALDVPMYFAYRKKKYIDCTGMTFRDFMAGKLPCIPGELPTLNDWENHLTTIFPEVRLKRYLEMRGADGGPWRRLCALPAFWVGVLYDEVSLQKVLDITADWTAEERQMLRNKVPKTGLKTPFRDGLLRHVAEEVVQLAKDGLERRGFKESGFLNEVTEVVRTESDGAANLIQKLRAINYALDELGQWCAYKVAQSFLTALQNDERANYQLDVKFQESYLNKVVSLLQCQLSEGAVSDKDTKVVESGNGVAQDRTEADEIEEGELPDSHVVSGGEHVDVIIGAAVADGKVTPKVQSLIKILLKYQNTEDFRAIIFVERVVSALVLPKVFAELPSLGFIRCASLIGHNNSHEMRTCQMQDTIAKFKDGRVTLLVATSVAEEGLDIRQCNVVIRFDLAKTVLAYIQSRGRARKPGSDYILMVERGNLSHEAFLRNARNSEETLRKEAIERTDLSHLKDLSRLVSVDTSPDTVYQVESTGAVVSLNSAVGLIHFYCSQLPSDRYSILRPEFIMERHEKMGGPAEYSCKLQLPCNAPFEKLEGPICSSMRLAQQAVCLAACKKLHEMGAFTDMLLPDKGSGEEREKVDQNDEGEPLPGTARHREFYPEGVADILKGEWILSGRDVCDDSKLLHLCVYAVECVNIGTSKDPFLTQVSDFAILFGSELDAEVLSMSMDLFVARTMSTKASLVFKGSIDISESQLASLKGFHVRLMSIVLDVDVEPSTTPWDPTKTYLFVPVVGDKSSDPVRDIDWDLIAKIINTDAWNNPLQRARPDVYLGTNERTLGGDRREYGFGKLRNGMAFGQKSHPTYGIRGAVAQFDVVKASGLLPARDTMGSQKHVDMGKGKLMMADNCMSVEDLVGRIVTAVHSGKRFYVDSVRYEMTAENSFPRKEGYLGPLEYSSYADYYKQKYGVELIYKQQPLIRGRGVSYCKNLLSPRFEHKEAPEGEAEENHDKTYYVFLPAELCLVHPLPGSLVRGAQRLPSIMRRVESMLLAIQLKAKINYQVPASKILEALTAASCQETFCYERAELLGDAYLKWVVSRFLFLKYPQKHEGQLTRMRQQMVSNMVLYQYALSKGLQSYIQADRFAPSRWAAPGVQPVFDEDTKDGDSSLFDQDGSRAETEHGIVQCSDIFEDDEMEDGELESDSSSYRVLSSKTLADVVEALIGVYYVEGGKKAANHLMKWIGIQVEFDADEIDCITRPSNVPGSILRSVNFDTLEGALNIKFKDKGLLVEAITHASRPSSGVSCYQRLEFVGDAVLDHLITKHLFFTYTDLPPGRLTDLRAAAVNNENFARVAVKHNLHVHLRHGSTSLEKQIRDFVKEVQDELSKPGFNSFGLSDCKAPKVLGDIVESIAGAIFLDSERNTAVVWEVFQPLLHPMVTPETLPMHPVRELQERCQQQAEGLEYKASRSGNLATVEVFIDGVQIGIAQNPQKKMAQKLAARNALAALKEKETAEATERGDENGKKKKNGNQTFTRQTLNDICLRRNWPMPSYRCINEGGPAHAKRFTFAVSVNTTDRGPTDECVGEPMPSVKKAKDSAAALLLELIYKLYS